MFTVAMFVTNTLSQVQPSHFIPYSDYGPIRHSNGLCLNVKNGSHSDNTSLIWSRDCTSRNAFFLVPHDFPPYHVASGKCVLPQGYVSSF